MSYFLQWLETSFYFCEGKAQNYLCIKILKDLKPSAHQLANFDGQDLLKSAVIRQGDLQENPHSGGSTGAFFFLRPLSYLMFWFYRISSDPAPVVYSIQDHPRVHCCHSLPVIQVINAEQSLKKPLSSPFKGHVSFGNKKLRTWPECWSQAALGCWAG